MVMLSPAGRFQYGVPCPGIRKLGNAPYRENLEGAEAILSKLSIYAGGMKDIARSARAVIVRLGLTPRFAETTEPSQIYMFV